MKEQMEISFESKLKPRVKNWLRLLESGNLKNKTILVLRWIKETNNVSFYGLRNQLDMPHQTLSGIISVLLDEGVIEVTGETFIEGNHYSKFAFVADQRERDLLIAKRNREKFFTWLKYGNENFHTEMNFILKGIISENIAVYDL